MERTVRVRLEAAVGSYQAALARAGASTRQLAGQVRTATTAGRRDLRTLGTAASSSRGQLTSLAAGATGLNATLVGAGGLAFGIKGIADAAIGWESAFADVRKTVDGTDQQLATIADGLREMSKQIPTSAQDLAGIAASAGQLGIATPNVLKFTRVVADLGETTNLAGEQGATQLARLANITQMSQDDFDRLGSTIVDLGNNFATTEAEISEMALRIAGAGTQVGLTEPEILAMAAALSSVGINAEAGGSAISRVMIDIANEVANGTDRVSQFATVAGMSATEFAAAWRDDAAGALTAFISGLGRLDETGGSALQALEELGITEIRTRDALLRAAGAGDLLSDAIERGNDAWEDNVALQEEAAQRYGTTEAKIDRAKNAVSDLATTIGEDLLPAIGDAAEGLQDLLDFEVVGPDVGGGLSVGDILGGALSGALRGDFTGSFGGDIAVDRAGQEQQRRQETSLTAMADEFEFANSAADTANGTMTAAERTAQQFRTTVDELAGAQRNLGVQTGTATAAILTQIEADRAAVDPFFALRRTLDAVSEAQSAYNEAVDKHGKSSEEAATAAVELTERVLAAQGAAVEAQGTFGDVVGRLEALEAQGLLTAGQVDAVRGVLDDTAAAADRYRGDYTANFVANTDQLDDAIDKLRLIAGLTANQPLVTPSAGNPGFGGATRQHDGGWVDGAGTAAGLAGDERLRILKVGEFVVNDRAAADHGGLLQAINTGRMHTGGPVGRPAGPMEVRTGTPMPAPAGPSTSIGRQITFSEGLVSIVTADAASAAAEAEFEMRGLLGEFA